MATRGGGRLREKLKKLYKMRTVIDVDISALERSLGVQLPRLLGRITSLQMLNDVTLPWESWR